MRTPELVPVPAYRPELPNAEALLPYLRRIDASRIYSNHGPLVAELETRLGTALQRPYSVLAAASGWAALVAGVLATAGRATPGRDLALCPAYTFVATGAAVQQCGYRPYLLDVDRQSWQLDPERVAAHPLLERVGVVVPVAPLGRPIAVHRWEAFQRDTGIPVVIDAAASMESVLNDPSEYLGAVAVALSFHATKVFATGEGGALIAGRPALLEAALRCLNFGFLGSRDSYAPSINGKMSEYHAAVGLAGLDRWPQHLAALQAVASAYRQCFDEAGLHSRCHVAPAVASNYAVFECRDAAQAQAMAAALQADAVESRLWYGSGLHRQPIFSDVGRDPLPVTDDLAPRLLGLPVAPDLPAQTVARIVAVVAALANR